ncbi:MAG: hypothetical protein K8F54_08180, partial [Altibacter sp.]|uniref:hypothetical protein n=1 Tax=Altibacter sp. TaxID=2024823 RepID=UPI001DEE9221
VRAGSAYFFECEKPPTPKLCCDIPDVDITLNRVGKTDKFNLNINSANSAIQEVEVSMIDYHAEYESESCKPKDIGIFGNINSTTTNFGGLLLTDNNTHAPVWEAGSPSVLNGSIGILISKPNLFDIRNCRNSKFYFCLKVKMTDTDCNICEQIVCGTLELGPSQFPGGGVFKK